MVVANNIPHHKRDMLESQGIEDREISELKFRKVAEKNNCTLSANHLTNEIELKSKSRRRETDNQIIEQPASDIDTKRLREQLSNLYSRIRL